jgi:hypothetical protein
MVQERSDSKHSELVRELKRQIRSLDLIDYTRGGIFSKGFTPDVLINLGGTIHDWVVIEVINSQRMLKHDLGGLIIVNSNLKAEGQSIRENIVVINSANITHDQWCDALPLVDQLRSNDRSNLICLRSEDISVFTSWLKRIMLESLIEKIEKANEELVSRFIESHES